MGIIIINDTLASIWAMGPANKIINSFIELELRGKKNFEIPPNGYK